MLRVFSLGKNHKLFWNELTWDFYLPSYHCPSHPSYLSEVKSVSGFKDWAGLQWFLNHSLKVPSSWTKYYIGGHEPTQTFTQIAFTFQSHSVLIQHALSNWILWPLQVNCFYQLSLHNKENASVGSCFHFAFYKVSLLGVSLSSVPAGKNPLSSICESAFAPEKIWS